MRPKNADATCRRAESMPPSNTRKKTRRARLRRHSWPLRPGSDADSQDTGGQPGYPDDPARQQGG